MSKVLSKQAAREWAKQQRRSLPDADYRRLNEALLRNLKKLINWPAVEYLHTFLPIERHREPDVRPLLGFIAEEAPALKVVVPKVKGATMEHYHLLPGMELELSSWGVPEPPESAPILTPPELEKINIVLVPLLALDRRGGRVGYGKGYYDAFLQLVPRALRIGVSLLEPLEEISGLEPHDIPLHMAVTPTRIYDFRAAAERAMHGHLIKMQNSVP